MTVEYFRKHAGATVMRSTDDPRMLLVGDTVPDTVRLPPDLREEYGHTRRVVQAFLAPCPCRCGQTVRHLELGELTVAECSLFFFYKTPQGQP